MRDDREGEINDDLFQMRLWARFPVKRMDRSNIQPTRGHNAECRVLAEKRRTDCTSDLLALVSRFTAARLEELYGDE